MRFTVVVARSLPCIGVRVVASVGRVSAVEAQDVIGAAAVRRALVGAAHPLNIEHMPTTSNDPYGGSERRSNPRLRELVDEMLASIRAAANVDLWTSDERSRYEADMARIMESVREHAIDHGYQRES